MEMVLSNGFQELSNEEKVAFDGGFVIAGITLTIGAKIAIGCFAAGVVIGVAWAMCD